MNTQQWMSAALCAQTDAETFYPEKGQSTQAAKKICASCPVKVQCLEYAIVHDERFGVWGGLSERERRRYRRGEYRSRTRCRNDHDLGAAGVDRRGRCRECQRGPAGRYHQRCRDRAIVPRQDTQHGTRTMYVNGCRCESCTRVNRVYQLERYHLHRGGAA